MIAELRRLASPDVAFLLDAAGGIMDGAHWYVDIVEINPPLIILLNMPAVLLGRWLQVSDVLVYRLGFALALLCSLGLTAYLIRRALGGTEVALRHGIVLLLALVLFPLPGEDFGQREHLVLALLLPYLALTAARAGERDALDPPKAAVIGVLAGIGVALKPHFLLVWLGAECYLRVVRGRWRLTPEGATIVATVCLYAVAVVTLVPEYVQLTRQLSGLYMRFLYDPIPHLALTAPGAAITFLSLLSFAALRERAGHPRWWRVLAVSVLTTFAAGLLQQKGLPYHFLPSSGLSLLLLGVVAMDARRPLGSWVRRAYYVVSASAGTALIVVSLAQAFRDGSGWISPEQQERRRMIDLVREHAAGSKVMVLSYHIGSTYPLVHCSGTGSALRFPHLWILPAQYLDQLHAAAPLRFTEGSEVGAAERYLRESVSTDLEAGKPRLIIVLRHARDLPENGLRRLDYLAYFNRDARFAKAMERYQWMTDIGEYTVYQRLPDGATRTGPTLRSSPGVADVLREDQGKLQIRLGEPFFLLGLVVFLIAAAILARRERSLGAG
jgi:hypothetical protein